MDSEAGRLLLSELDADLHERYGGGTPVQADAAEFEPPGGAFLIAYVDGEPQACAGYRRYDDRTAELKRMFVRSTGRRQGLARRLLLELEAGAAAAGYEQMWLETGVPQHEAMTLYEASGYARIAAFGQYAWAEDQRCYGKSLR
jgi:GNAT superfamily N-acetyltransferase